MHIKVRNFVGIETADIDVAGIMLIGSVNAGGKSSLRDGITAVLSGDPMTRGITRKGDGGTLVRTGADTAFVGVSTEASKARMTWPSASTPAILLQL